MQGLLHPCKSITRLRSLGRRDCVLCGKKAVSVTLSSGWFRGHLPHTTLLRESSRLLLVLVLVLIVLVLIVVIDRAREVMSLGSAVVKSNEDREEDSQRD